MRSGWNRLGKMMPLLAGGARQDAAPPRKEGRAGGEVAWGRVDSHREHKELRE